MNWIETPLSFDPSKYLHLNPIAEAAAKTTKQSLQLSMYLNI